ncbi:MAG: hypothetical protein KAH13_05380 [Tenericutes bacterium]|nr:hypothetical protein [Mycoplasmatota bacterium]
MRFLFSLADISLTTIIIIAVVLIVIVILLAVFTNSARYSARYKGFYKRLDKTINKRYNGNLLIEDIVTSYAREQTNTYKTLKGKGKRKVKKYFEYYIKNIPEQVMLKSFTTSDKNKNQIMISLLDEYDKVLYRWDKSKKLKGLIKACNKFQMLNGYIAYLFELPLNMYEAAPYRFINHDNDYILTYEVVKKIKKQRKIKQKKLSKKELKAQAKVAKAKEKKARRKR